MPLYEFFCGACHRKSTLLVGLQDELSALECPHCGARDLKKQVSRFRMGRGEDARLEEAADALERMDDVSDPTGVMRQVRELGKALDEDVSEDLEDLFESDLSADLEEGNASNGESVS